MDSYFCEKRQPHAIRSFSLNPRQHHISANNYSACAGFLTNLIIAVALLGQDFVWNLPALRQSLSYFSPHPVTL